MAQSWSWGSQIAVKKTDPACIAYFKVITFWKNDFRKMKVLQNFGSWDQEIDLRFANNKPQIPTLRSRIIRHLLTVGSFETDFLMV